MTDQARAMKEIAGATTSIGKQIRLLSGANSEHSGGAARVLTQLKSIRPVSERNTQGVRQTRGSTGELVSQAEAASRGARDEEPPLARQRRQRPRMNERAAAAENDRRIGVFTTDTDLVIRSWDSVLEHMTGIARPRCLRKNDQRTRTGSGRTRSGRPVPGASDFGVRSDSGASAPQVPDPVPDPPKPSSEFEQMQQRVVVGALRDDSGAVGLVVTVEDVTARLESERRIARKLREGTAAERLAAIAGLAGHGTDRWTGPARNGAARRALAGPARGGARRRSQARCGAGRHDHRRAAGRPSQFQPAEQCAGTPLARRASTSPTRSCR